MKGRIVTIDKRKPGYSYKGNTFHFPYIILQQCQHEIKINNKNYNKFYCDIFICNTKELKMLINSNLLQNYISFYK